MTSINITTGSWQSVVTTTEETFFQNRGTTDLYLKISPVASGVPEQTFHLDPYMGQVVGVDFSVSAVAVGGTANLVYFNNVFTPFKFETVTNLLADTSLAYVAGATKTLVTVGQYIYADNFSYLIAASGATDQHVTTAGGVKLYVQPGSAGYNALAFGADNTNTANNVTVFATIAAMVAAAPTPTVVHFPSGIYSYSVSPNWAVSGAVYSFGGEVRFRYTGTGNAVILDGGAAGAGVYNCQFGEGGRPKIECPATGLNAIYARAYHLGLIKAQVMGAGSASAGLKTAWLVSTEIDVKVSINDEGWYLAAKPDIGIDLDQRGAGEKTSYCEIINPDCSGPGIGIQHTSTLGNNIRGGACQACTLYGMFASTGADHDKYWGTDFEVNGVVDAVLGANSIKFYNCDSDNSIVFGAASTNCGLIGGLHKSVTIDLGARNVLLDSITYNRANTGGVITDAGTGTIRRDCTKSNVFNVTDAAAEREGEIYVTSFDDFFGDTLAAEWSGQSGTDPQCLAPTASGSNKSGLMVMGGGDDAVATYALNGSQFNQGALHWRVDQGGFEITARFYLEAITNVSVFFGMTDTVLFEMPFTLGAADALTSNASNAVGVLFDTGADTDQWHLVGVKADVDATKQALGLAPVANTFETFKLYVDNVGTARLFRNGVAIGTDMLNAVTNTALLTPCFAIFSRGAATRLLACDYLSIRAQR